MKNIFMKTQNSDSNSFLILCCISIKTFLILINYKKNFKIYNLIRKNEIL